MLRMLGENTKENHPSLLLGITLSEVLYLTAHPGEILLVDYTDLGEKMEIALTISVDDKTLEQMGEDILAKRDNEETRQ